MNKPEYWYKQSSVIPYRIKNGNLEVLLITTRKNKKWIFPKGIVDIGLTPEQSAVKEALEEAGVEGELLPYNLGSYKYKKWGGQCTVEVFGLNVIRILDDWEENFRERKWVFPSKIANYTMDSEITAILNKLVVELKKI